MFIEDVFAGVPAQGTVQAAVWVITLGIYIMKLLACGNSGISAPVWFYWSSILPCTTPHEFLKHLCSMLCSC